MIETEKNLMEKGERAHSIPESKIIIHMILFPSIIKSCLLKIGQDLVKTVKRDLLSYVCSLTYKIVRYISTLFTFTTNSCLNSNKVGYSLMKKTRELCFNTPVGHGSFAFNIKPYP